MKAVGYTDPGAIDRAHALLDLDLDAPEPGATDLLVEVRAVSVNPIDTKMRRRAGPDEGARAKVLGYDAVGVVREVGDEARGFAPGDEVFYAGAIDRPGTNAELHTVDHRIVGRKPATLDWAQAAALPLTSITAWEALFDRLRAGDPVPGGTGAVLIVGGGGGVASVAVQLARRLTDLTVIATASRDVTRDWVKGLGAHHVIDHSQPLAEQVRGLGIAPPGLVFSTTHTDAHLDEIAQLIAPQGRVALIDDPETLDIRPFKQKSVSIHWESMFTRPVFGTADMAEQGRLLNRVAELVDDGTLRTTMGEHYGRIEAANLIRAHRDIESHRMRGKIVLEGF